MTRWFRVFAATAKCPPTTTLPGAKFGKSGDQWFWAELPGVRVERFESAEEGIRAELNSWAAVVEATLYEPAALMERIIQTRQLFTIKAETEAAEPLAEDLARKLAAATGGCYQADEAGWYDTTGKQLPGGEADA